MRYLFGTWFLVLAALNPEAFELFLILAIVSFMFLSPKEYR